MTADASTFMATLRTRHPHQPEFLQAAEELTENVIDVVMENPAFQNARILDRITEPERAVLFRVTWENDQGGVEVNRGYRIQFNSALGPYKGGLRFHPSVNLSVLKFLGFEQIFKNALTGLPMGGGKGWRRLRPEGPQ